MVKRAKKLDYVGINKNKKGRRFKIAIHFNLSSLALIHQTIQMKSCLVKKIS
jgi:hypothetical protein